MRRTSTVHVLIAMTILVSFFALVAACGPSARERTLRTTLVGVNSARDGFVTWDARHQQAIAATAASLETGKAALAVYRVERTTLVAAFEVAYRALAVAALEPSEKNMTAAFAAASDLRDAILAMKGLIDP